MKRHFTEIIDTSLDLKEDSYLSFYKCIGEGTYGKVYLAKFGDDTKERAIKVLKSNNSFSVDTPPIIRELLVGGTCGQRSGVLRFDSGLYGIVSNVGHCTLQSIAPNKIPIDCARIIAKRLLEKIVLIHDKGCMHRDLKPENILLKFNSDDDFPEVDIIDFGLSSPILESDDSNVTSLWWRAPEVLIGLPHSKSIDVWSFGVIFANLCCNTKITTSKDDKGALNDIWKTIGFPSPKTWDIQDFVETQHIRAKGFDIDKEFKHVRDILQLILKPNPVDRPSANELLLHDFFNEPFPITQEGRLWIKEVNLNFNKMYTFDVPLKTFSNLGAFLSSSFLDSTYVESESLYILNALKNITPEHLKAIKSISIFCDWDRQITNKCILITDRTLNGTSFFPTDPKALVCASSYVTSCLYGNLEPSMAELKKWTKMQLNISVIENGVHAVLSALKYRLLPENLCNKIMKMEKWEIIQKCLK